MNLASLEQEALQLELLQAKVSMRAYTRLMLPNYIIGPYHGLLCDTLDRVMRGELKRLIITAPPQGGKSKFVSNLFASKWMATYPDIPGLFLSYGAEHAEDKARTTRDYMRSPAYRLLYPAVRLRKDSHAVSNYRIEGHEGGMKSAGLEGEVTGFSGGMVVIDDPHKNLSQLRSRATREKVWQTYRDVIIPRVWPNAPLIIIATRWDVDDLIGRVLNHSREDWEVIRVPALSETQEDRDAANALYNLPEGLPDPLGREGVNESYFPEMWPSESLISKKHEMGSLSFAAEYQGAPRLAEGNVIKRDWLQKKVPYAPLDARRVRFWDKAATEDGGSHSAGVLIAEDSAGLFYIEDLVYGQWSAHERDEIIYATAEADALRTVVVDQKRPNMAPERLSGYNATEIWLEQEPAAGGKQSAEISARQLAKFGARFEPASKGGDKDVRLRPFVAACERGDVYLVRGVWNDVYVDSLCAVRYGVYEERDIADGTAGAFNKLETTGGWIGGAVDKPSRARNDLFTVED